MKKSAQKEHLPRKGERGVLLLELVIALAIAGLAAGALPALYLKGGDLLDRLTVEYEAHRLLRDIRYLEEMSATYRAINGEITAAPSEAKPTLTIRVPGTYRISQGATTVISRTIDTGVKLTTNRTEIAFQRGIAPTTTITLTKGNIRRYVIVDIVGRVRLSQLPP